jgi:hypothetical protein
MRAKFAEAFSRYSQLDKLMNALVVVYTRPYSPEDMQAALVGCNVLPSVPYLETLRPLWIDQS